MKKSICVLLAACAALGASGWKEVSTGVEPRAREKSSFDCVGAYMPVGAFECAELCDKVMANIDEIVDGYNSNVNTSDKAWRVRYVEHCAPVYFVDDDAYGAYIDFDGDNGYIVARDEHTLCEIVPHGDLDYLRTAREEILYSYGDGFLYRDGNGVLRKLGEESSADDPNDLYADGEYADGAYGGEYIDRGYVMGGCVINVDEEEVKATQRKVLLIALGVFLGAMALAFVIEYAVGRYRKEKAKSDKTDKTDE